MAEKYYLFVRKSVSFDFECYAIYLYAYVLHFCCMGRSDITNQLYNR